MKNKSEYNSAQEWKKAKPEDYNHAVRKKILNTICEYYGWEIPITKKWVGDINELKIITIENFNKAIPLIESYMNDFYDKNRKISGVRLRVELNNLKNITNKFKRSLTLENGVKNV